jgi:VWFA-related protein
MARGIFVLAVLSVAGTAALAQEAPKQEAATPTEEVATKEATATFSSKVNLVMVPVVVRDRSGHAVGTLKKEDFQLFDRGKIQVISRFQIEKEADRIKPVLISSDDAEALKPEGSEPPPGARSAVIPSRFIAYVFDDLHLEAGDMLQARNAARQHLAENLRPDERVAIYTTSGKVMLDFTDDLGKIGEAMQKISPKINTTQHDCPPVSFYQADQIQNRNDAMALQVATSDALTCASMNPQTDMQSAQNLARAAASQALAMGEQDSRTALMVMKDIAARMAASPGERMMVLISGGFYLTDFERREEIEMIDRAIRSNVMVNSLDARGLTVFIAGGDASVSNFNRSMSPQSSILRTSFERTEQLALSDVLGELSDGTGGILFQNNNDLREGFKRTTQPPEFIYMLGFSPQNLKLDGAYHALKVSFTVKNGNTLVARRGYYAPRHEADEAELAHEEIREALFSREEIQDIPIQVQTQFFKTDDEKAKLAVLARVDLKPLHFRKDQGRNWDNLIIVAGVFDRNGNLVTAIQKTVEMRLKDETFEVRVKAGITIRSSLDVTPGSYVVRVVLRDQEGKMMTARNRVVEIPY